VKTLEEVVAEAGLLPVSWVTCLCRCCGEFRLSIPPMKRKRQQIACPRCGKTIWAEESARGGTKREQPLIEAEENFSHDERIASFIFQPDWKRQIEVADL